MFKEEEKDTNIQEFSENANFEENSNLLNKISLNHDYPLLETLVFTKKDKKSDEPVEGEVVDEK